MMNQGFVDTVNECLNEHGLSSLPENVLLDLFEGLRSLGEMEIYSMGWTPGYATPDPMLVEIAKLKENIDSLIHFAASKGFHLGLDGNRPYQTICYSVGSSHYSYERVYT